MPMRTIEGADARLDRRSVDAIDGRIHLWIDAIPIRRIAILVPSATDAHRHRSSALQLMATM
jgi:hypothetical protein